MKTARISMHHNWNRSLNTASLFRFRHSTTSERSDFSRGMTDFSMMPESHRYTIRRSAHRRGTLFCGSGVTRPKIRVQLKPDPKRAPRFIPIEVPPKVVLAARRRRVQEQLPDVLEE